ncbi:tripartite tricarboxylate transporter substrate binding protein [Marinovum sp. 2_MG-2023]|uniref:tripartite tricarboxylate transporter substrate binding protein n=1 Tax=unclassified Marinovum TaxID=2647166 RepID=UPI0026E1A700|nr:MULTISPECIES: tripartite tricarboxylate transporter substrate binding protein [unclassified Marinovum]MDO6730711.1 tripartite tricarboxylate transporter substrate binding protein [Marinovum sp. 2_MG-2023]MDO6780084.1 tripartite tricarboxylate transporter substrate binding protein [Marinovum sp. 1_MG-2023]
MMNRRNFAALGALAVAGAMTAMTATPALAEYPERPITLIVPWGAGGGTDATGRMIGTLLQAELGQPVVVVNRDGGSGVVGHTAIATADPDGYTIGVATVEIGMMHWAGLTDLTWTAYTPIALYNADAAGVIVRADSDWTSASDVLAAVSAEPGKYKGSGTGQGGIWHLALAGMLNDAGISPDAVPWVPSKGSAAGLQELAAGGVDIVTSSVVEGAAMIAAGQAKALNVMASERIGAFADVPTLKETTGSDWQLAAWRGIVGPVGMPDEATQKLTVALENVWNSDEFQEFMNGRGFGLTWKSGDDFAGWMESSDASLGAVMTAVGLAK